MKCTRHQRDQIPETSRRHHTRPSPIDGAKMCRREATLPTDRPSLKKKHCELASLEDLADLVLPMSWTYLPTRRNHPLLESQNLVAHVVTRTRRLYLGVQSWSTPRRRRSAPRGDAGSVDTAKGSLHRRVDDQTGNWMSSISWMLLVYTALDVSIWSSSRYGSIADINSIPS